MSVYLANFVSKQRLFMINCALDDSKIVVSFSFFKSIVYFELYFVKIYILCSIFWGNVVLKTYLSIFYQIFLSPFWVWNTLPHLSLFLSSHWANLKGLILDSFHNHFSLWELFSSRFHFLQKNLLHYHPLKTMFF